MESTCVLLNYCSLCKVCCHFTLLFNHFLAVYGSYKTLNSPISKERHSISMSGNWYSEAVKYLFRHTFYSWMDLQGTEEVD